MTEKKGGLHGPIHDIMGAWKFKLLKSKQGGKCGEKFKYDPDSEICTVHCLESDKCQQYMLRSNEEVLRIAKAAVEGPPEEPLTGAKIGIERPRLMLPKPFRTLEQQILEIDTTHVGRFSQATIITYGYKYQKMASIIPPISDEGVYLVFHKCHQKRFKDPKKALFVGNPRFPTEPTMLVRPVDISYAVNLVKQAKQILEAKIKLFANAAERTARKKSQKATTDSSRQPRKSNPRKTRKGRATGDRKTKAVPAPEGEGREAN